LHAPPGLNPIDTATDPRARLTVEMFGADVDDQHDAHSGADLPTAEVGTPPTIVQGYVTAAAIVGTTPTNLPGVLFTSAWAPPSLDTGNLGVSSASGNLVSDTGIPGNVCVSSASAPDALAPPSSDTGIPGNLGFSSASALLGAYKGPTTPRLSSAVSPTPSAWFPSNPGITSASAPLIADMGPGTPGFSSPPLIPSAGMGPGCSAAPGASAGLLTAPPGSNVASAADADAPPPKRKFFTVWPTVDLADRLAKLAQLFAAGALTEEEFKAAKAMELGMPAKIPGPSSSA
jgi:hypothetical protein